MTEIQFADESGQNALNRLAFSAYDPDEFPAPVKLGAGHSGLFASLERKLPLMLCFLAHRRPATLSEGLGDEWFSRMAFGPPRRRPLQARLLVRGEPLVV